MFALITFLCYIILQEVKILNKRLKEIRLLNKMSQEEFGKKIGIESRAHISALESGNRNITDRIVKDICREFNINENWLRTGTGEMQASISQDDRYSHNIGKLAMTDDETIIHWVNTIAESNPQVLKEIESFMKKLLGIN